MDEKPAETAEENEPPRSVRRVIEATSLLLLYGIVCWWLRGPDWGLWVLLFWIGGVHVGFKTPSLIPYLVASSLLAADSVWQLAQARKMMHAPVSIYEWMWDIVVILMVWGVTPMALGKVVWWAMHGKEEEKSRGFPVVQDKRE